MPRTKRFRWSMVTALLLVLAWALPAWAVEIRNGDMVTIAEGTVKGPLFVAGNNITINADVEGDVFAAGQNIIINGRVDGDLIAAGQSIRVGGAVSGDVRAAGNQIEVLGQVDGSVTGAANMIDLRDASRVKRDVLLFGNTIGLYGSIERQVMGSAQQIRINGPVNGDVVIWEVQNLNLGPSAVVKGSISYGSPGQADISPQAQTNGITRIDKPVTPPKARPDNNFSWWGALGWIAAGVLIWGLIYLLFPRLLPAVGETVKRSPGAVLGWGFLVLLLTPLAALLLAVTLVGIPLALLVIFIYIFLLYCAKVLAADVLGRYLAAYLGWEGRMPFFLPFIIAFLALILLAKIPVLGFFISLLAACLALGALTVHFYQWRSRRLPAPAQGSPPASAVNPDSVPASVSAPITNETESSPDGKQE